MTEGWAIVSVFVGVSVGMLVFSDYDWWRATIGLATIVLSIVLPIYSCSESPDYIKREVLDKAAEVERKKPHVIREVDGCKIYTFHAGDRWHYFTRCADRVTTDSTYDVRSGKTTRTESESIATEVRK